MRFALLFLLLPSLAHAQMMGFWGEAAAGGGGGGVAIESGFPVGSASRASTNPKTQTFSTAGASTLVLFTHTAGAAVSAVSSPSLTWTRQLGPTGSIWVYTAPSTGALTNETVSVTFGAGSDGAISLFSVTGTAGSLTNTARTSGSSGAIQFSFTSNTDSSLLLWSTIDFNQGAAGSAATGNTVDLDNLDGNGERYVTGHYSTQPTAGTYTLGETNTSTNWQIGAIEIPPG